MKKELQERLMDNFNEKNIENVGKLIEEQIPEKVEGMFVNESRNGVDIKITEESRKVCAKSLLR